ncbi:hypothetical protein TEA_009120 [Camellia sinensis var. sinensis]|uniref:RRM domain-containing protein n=1 Tax=Camellia sinensis var. sinensis TaxID=542762 RepID=A0A4S4D8Y6_CAMSN|nr:hypothetical protein TEA_009120 [Camellia sinensis var. sinensis]
MIYDFLGIYRTYEVYAWVPMDHTNSKIGTDAPPSSTPNWTINISDVRTVKASNISLATSEKDIKEFFSFFGDIQYVEMQRETETSHLAYVTFKESQGADTAMLLTGSTIANLSVSITRVENYQLTSDAPPLTPKETNPSPSGSTVEKAEDVISIGTAVVNEKVREMDEKFQVTEKTKSAFAAAEQKASNAGTAITSNPDVSTGASWFSNAFSVVTKAAEDVSTRT